MWAAKCKQRSGTLWDKHLLIAIWRLYFHLTTSKMRKCQTIKLSQFTPPRTHRISGLKSQVFKSTFLACVMRTLLMSFFFLWLFPNFVNFILLIHFPTYGSIDSHDLFYLNSWDSQSSAKVSKVLQKFGKSSAKVLQNFFKSCKILQKFCKNCKSSKSSANVTKVLQNLQKFQQFCKHRKSSVKINFFVYTFFLSLFPYFHPWFCKPRIQSF